jgi:hypothetical protein
MKKQLKDVYEEGDVINYKCNEEVKETTIQVKRKII